MAGDWSGGLELSAGAWFGLAAAALWVLGLLVYAVQIAHGACRPNVASWAMWTYGALVLLLLRANLELPREVLVLPAVGTLGGFLVIARVIARNMAPAPEPRDWLVLAFNAGIVLWSLLLLAGPAADLGIGQELGAVFVVLSALGAVTAAWPTLRATCLDPGREHPVAWFVWSAAHGFGALAVMGAGLSWHFLVYPLLCQAIHLLIGVFALGESESFAGTRGGTLR